MAFKKTVGAATFDLYTAVAVNHRLYKIDIAYAVAGHYVSGSFSGKEIILTAVEFKFITIIIITATDEAGVILDDRKYLILLI